MTKDNKEKSNCCNAPVKVEGKTTKYYVCSKCNKACDIQVIEKEIEELIRDITKAGFMAKSEARRRMKNLVAQAKAEVLDEVKKELKRFIKPEDLDYFLVKVISQKRKELR